MCKRAMNAKGLVKIQKLTKAKAEVCAAIEAQRDMVNLKAVKQVGFISCSRSRDCYFNMAMGSDCAVSNIWPANHFFSQFETELRGTQLNEVGSKELCSQLGARPLNTTHEWPRSEHSTTAEWIRQGVDFEEDENRRARKKPSKSGWDRLKLNPHATFLVEVEGVFDLKECITRNLSRWSPIQISTPSNRA